jgi:hypothetical protein
MNRRRRRLRRAPVALRTNYIANPRFILDSNSDGLADGVSYAAVTNCTTADDLIDSGNGYYIQKITITGGVSASANPTIVLASSASGTFTTADSATSSVWAKLVSATGCTVSLYVGSRTAADAAIGGSNAAIEVSTGYVRYTVSRSFASDTNTDRARLYIQAGSFSQGDSFEIWFYRPMLHKGGAPAEYGDGSLSGWQWNGTANNSTSSLMYQ